MKHWLTAIGILALCVGVAADKKIDPRLATMKKVVIVPIDELSDKPVAACINEAIFKSTPVESVKTKEEADAILKVGFTKKKATIAAYLPDGTTKFWSEELPLKVGFGLVQIRRDDCGQAERLIETLRDAMKKARDQK